MNNKLFISFFIFSSMHSYAVTPSTVAELTNDHQPSKKLTANLRPPHKLNSFSEHSLYNNTPFQFTTCKISDFENLQGSILINKIKSANTNCVNQLFSANLQQTKAIFTESQMLAVASEMVSLASNYSGDNQNNILQVILFLRAGYYANWNFQDQLDPYSENLKKQVAYALDTFIANSHFKDINAKHGDVLSEAIILIDSSELNAKYLDTLAVILYRFNDNYLKYWGMRAAVNSIFTILFRGHQFNDFQQKVKDNPRMANTLSDFIKTNEKLLDTDNEFLLVNATREMARFLQYNTDSKKQVQSNVKRIVDDYSMLGSGAALWIGAAEMVSYYDPANCSYYNVCNFKDKLAAAVLPIRHQCDKSIVIRAQNISNQDLAITCNKLEQHKAVFHNKLNTHYNPVADDYNETLEVVTFNTRKDYQTYAGALFDISTDNGGMYLEGNPADPNNQARFIAYERSTPNQTIIWNLEHEYTHYLDGRFNMWGGFNDLPLYSTVWWVEGLGEYMAYGDDYQAALDLAKTKAYQLSDLFYNNYNSGVNRIYRWGYLAVRYMFENQQNTMQQMLVYFRKGDYSNYNNYLNQLRYSFNADFHNWLDKIVDGDNSNCKGNTSTDRNDELITSKPKTLTSSYSQMFFIYVPDCATKFSLKLSGGTGDADLYLNQTGWPNTDNYDYASKQTGNEEEILINSPDSGYYHIMVNPKKSYRQVKLSAHFSSKVNH
ncbi:collagenase [Endozoicomonas sp. SM1973]|uniref:microbial collagenase n=1 Tax=Spartinivicinus marinus TaxID=2994442 RepID=A0A853I6S9_9GAMM|nr:M9 family metallopeptidase [Spartinivicinus marinus]MCX4026267.1 M9 family metallopeptidase [Spartinivicinus marinus]NYZ68469.1 collagenase [Spartinivicinus marinus]